MKKYRYSLKEMAVRLLKIAAPIKSYLIISTLASIFGNLAHIGLMGFGALTLLSAAGITDTSTVFAGIMTFLSAVLIPVCRYLEGVYSHIGAYGLLASLRVRLFDTIDRIAPAFMVERHQGDLLNIAVADIETLEFFFAHTIGPMFTVIILPLTTLIIAGFCNPSYIGVLLPVFILISVIIPLAAMRTGRSIGMRYREGLGELNTRILESVYGIRDLQIFGHGKERLGKVLEQNTRVNKAAHGLVLHQQALSSLPSFFVYLGRILIIYTAARLAEQGTGDPAAAILVSFVTTASFSSTFSLTFVVSHLLETFAAAERIFLIEYTAPAATETDTPVSCGPVETIQFNKVSFAYPHTDAMILKDADFTIHKGDRIGILGESGAGKSTLLRLLLRFYDPVSGVIEWNGIDEKQLKLSEVHKRIAMLEQETYLFDASIAENIALADPDASPEAIREAARRAGIDSFIDTLPEGYDTQMGQMGSRLSGGERQRIGIARVMLADPDVVVMDEPTSSLDILHEKELLHTLRTEYADKTVILISHRPSTLTDCTRILKLEGCTLREQ